MEYTVIIPTREGPHGRQFLMVLHAERGWEFPGGKLGPKEGPVRCALREFREETGHLLSDPKYLFKLEKDNGLCHAFTGGLGEIVSVVSDDEPIEKFDWFSELPEPLAFPDDPFEQLGDAVGIKLV